MATLPNTKIEFHEVRDLLNAEGGSVDNKYGSLFKVTAKINKWAKYKPESYDTMFGLTENDRYRNNYGFNVKELGGNIEKVFSDALNGWEYILPSGGEDSLFRIGDFRGYNPDAMPPFDLSGIIKEVEVSSLSYLASFQVIVPEGAEIDMQDISAFDDVGADYYMFIARRKTGATYEYIKSSTIQEDLFSSGRTFLISFPNEGTWECVFCMGKNISEDIESRTDLIPLPEGYFQFVLRKKAIFISITYVSPRPPALRYDSETMKLSFGGEIFYLSVKASSESVTSTELQFGFNMMLIDSSGNEMSIVDVYANEESDNFTYSGSTTKEWMVVSSFQDGLFLDDYFSAVDVYNASKLRLRPIARTVNGNGVPSVEEYVYDFSL